MNRICNVDQRELVRLLRLNDSDAQAELLRRFSRDIRYTIEQTMKNMAVSDVEVDDIFQITFLNVIEKIHTYKGSGLKSWISTIATNQANMVRRHLEVRDRVLRPPKKDGKVGEKNIGEDHRSLDWMVTSCFKSTCHLVEVRKAVDTIDAVFKKHKYSEGKRAAIKAKLRRIMGYHTQTHSEIETITELEYGERHKVSVIWPVFLGQCEARGFQLCLGKKYKNKKK